MIVILLAGTLPGFSQLSTPAAKPTPDRFAPLDLILQSAVAKQQIPGVVCIVGHNGEVIYRKAWGFRAVNPILEPMTVDTVFDMASLTKVMATTGSIMRLVQLGQIKLNDPVAKYIPDFAQNGKEDVTIRQLLTHYSGLRADLDLRPTWSGMEEGYRRANAEKLINPPGSTFLYSDINFIVLGELVQKVSGVTLNQYAETLHLRAAGDEYHALSSATVAAGAHRAHPGEREDRRGFARSGTRSHGSRDGRSRRPRGTVLDRRRYGEVRASHAQWRLAGVVEGESSRR